MKLYQLLPVIMLFPVTAICQSLAINTDGSTAHPNAMLDIRGTNKGLLIPRGDAATRTALNANTAKGLLMYDTVLNTVWLHNGNGLATGWNSLSTGTNYWQLNGALGTEIKNTNAGGFWSANATTVNVNPPVIQPPVSGSGTRIMWMPQRSAFRAGTVTNNNWNADSIGSWSFATGYDSKAIGDFSTALGRGTTASGAYSTALGVTTSATGNAASAFGSLALASGDLSTAMGHFTIAKSLESFAIGRFNDTTGVSSGSAWIDNDPLFIIGNGTTDVNRHNALVVYKDGNMILKNPTTVTVNPAGFTVPVSGSGTRMMWLPEKSAFRSGTVTGTDWNADSIGLYSFAVGYNTRAKGIGSVAFGNTTIASGSGSFATGFFSNAINSGSIAMGQGAYAAGSYSIAAGNNASALGVYTIALGNTVNATGDQTIAIGNNSDAVGVGSTAIGNNVTAGGTYSVSMGNSTSANGDNSTAFGVATKANSYGSFAIGRYNDSIAGSSRTAWVSTDPLFYVGNGTNLVPANALVIYKNGNTDISGYTQLGTTADGAPAIKMKKLTTTSSSSQGGVVTVAHGLNRAKILGVHVLLTYAAGVADIPGPYLDVAGYEYNWQVTSTDINIYNKTGNSANILSKPVRILITYEE